MKTSLGPNKIDLHWWLMSDEHVVLPLYFVPVFSAFGSTRGLNLSKNFSGNGSRAPDVVFKSKCIHFCFLFFSKWFSRHFRWTLDLSHLRKEDANLHGPFSAGSESRQIPAGICRIWNVGTKVYFQSWRDISRVAGGLAISKKSKRSICESVCTKRRCQKVASCGTITYQIPKDTFEDDDFPNFPLVIWWFPWRICFTKHAPQKIDGTKSQFEMGWYFTRRFVG